MAEMMTISKAEWERMNERLDALEKQNKLKVDYKRKFCKEVNQWLERQDSKRIEQQRTAIYEAVKSSLEFKSLDELNEENYQYAVNVFEQQKFFFRRRNFPEGVIAHE
ncbi:hypothetical protein ACJZQ5_002104 [Enterococcus hirae]|uniref:Uncharacterized protein n=2 Tax=Enterococcus hirae TaxID=1354 RepID=I6T4G2_ENTHA|nr:hypothetical protein [Enterococcus hirae]AFM69526.1 hypothetical protein EHR_02750 [Enterococcus hirae ATCC 9790]EMF0077983.1 hypothetical protein [Enterococcus hirae]EMF0166123.1 hypothetical protein [Enterococcus hirae]EMF0256965.1 hypothetical protein [Enterococcus hirae]EMF0447961.1 hypothetical protein [Enterococcus hirae]